MRKNTLGKQVGLNKKSLKGKSHRARLGDLAADWKGKLPGGLDNPSNYSRGKTKGKD